MQTVKDGETTEKSFKTQVLFTAFGFLCYVSYPLILTSTEDLLAHTSPASSSIWISDLVPFTIVTITVPYIFDRLPPLVFVLALFPLSAGGLCCILLSGSNVWLKFLGIGLFGAMTATMDATTVCLTGYFEKSTVKAYFIGSGFSLIFAPIYYTAMTSWFQISYKIAIAIIVIMQPFGYLICYLLLENRRQNVRMGYRTITEEDPSDDNKDEVMDTGNKDLTKKNDETTQEKYLTTKEKLYHSLQVLPHIFQILISDAMSNMTSSGVVTSLAFSNSPFLPSDHYKYYSIMNFAGLFVGRSYLGWADIIKPGLADKILIRRTWILVMISVCHMTFLVLASWYRFLPNVWLPFVLLFTLGFCTDLVVTNITVAIGEIEDFRVRELSQGLLIFGMGIGSVCGTVLAQVSEKVLVSHCLTIASDTANCFTREIDLSNITLSM